MRTGLIPSNDRPTETIAPTYLDLTIVVHIYFAIWDFTRRCEDSRERGKPRWNSLVFFDIMCWQGVSQPS